MTSGGFLGLDPELVGQMATRFEGEAQNIGNLISQMTSVVSSNIPNNWKGADAQRFQSEWESSLVPQLRNVEQALRQAATTARRNVQAQVDVANQL